MKIAILSAFLATVASVQGFAPIATNGAPRVSSALQAKYNSMDEILALFPEDLPVLINFYDANTENAIKDDILRVKTLLKDRATVVSIKQQDYPELAKKWDAEQRSPSMILFQDGQPVTRVYEQTFYLDIVAKVGQFCRPAGEEHKPIS